MASSYVFNAARTGFRRLNLTPKNKGALVGNLIRKNIVTIHGTLIEEPKKVKFGFIKVIFVMGLGLFIGAQIAKNGAAVLSESNIFNPEVDDDEDDD